MTVETVTGAYGRRAAEYAAMFGTIDAAAERDRTLVRAWASTVDGPILDVGCGPGQWTRWLDAEGFDVEGLDPTPELLDEARRRHPAGRYRPGRVENLGVPDGSLGGALVWYSLIHTPPAEIGAAFDELARCVRPGGGLAVGFFTGPELVPFDHAVCTAYYWPIEALADVVETAGFVVTGTDLRTDPGVRTQGLITASRRDV